MGGARISILATAIAVLALVRMIYTNSAFGTGPITIGMQVAAVVLMLYARITFGLRSFHAAANPTEGGLVTKGPYALVRNPIYAAVILFTSAALIAHWSVENALLAVAITVAMLVRIHFEEKFLRQHYRGEYEEYEQRVKRLLPYIF
jgi:protein-S-isoprenylcysteine O-methyltransferase Ste14